MLTNSLWLKEMILEPMSDFQDIHNPPVNSQRFPKSFLSIRLYVGHKKLGKAQENLQTNATLQILGLKIY